MRSTAHIQNPSSSNLLDHANSSDSAVLECLQKNNQTTPELIKPNQEKELKAYVVWMRKDMKTIQRENTGKAVQDNEVIIKALEELRYAIDVFSKRQNLTFNKKNQTDNFNQEQTDNFNQFKKLYADLKKYFDGQISDNLHRAEYWEGILKERQMQQGLAYKTLDCITRLLKEINGTGSGHLSTLSEAEKQVFSRYAEEIISLQGTRKDNFKEAFFFILETLGEFCKDMTCITLIFSFMGLLTLASPPIGPILLILLPILGATIGSFLGAVMASESASLYLHEKGISFSTIARHLVGMHDQFTTQALSIVKNITGEKKANERSPFLSSHFLFKNTAHVPYGTHSDKGSTTRYNFSARSSS